MARIAIQLVTWNGAAYLPYLFASLRAQTYRDWELLILDNHSSDQTVAVLNQEILDVQVPHELWVNETNQGFAQGHNKLFNKRNTEFAVLLNQDIYLAPDCLEKMVFAMEEDGGLAAVAPRLMRWDFSVRDDLEKSKTAEIDSLGLKIFKNRRVVEQNAGELWETVRLSAGKHRLLPVFGVSGALPMYRRSALNTISFHDQTLFDASYHSYKEDIDIAYRLKGAGYNAAVVLDSVAWHDRSVAGADDLSDRAGVKNKTTQSFLVQYHSYKNHLATLYKNEYWQNFLLDFPWIMWYELKKLMYYLLFNRPVLKGFADLWNNRAGIRQKKSDISRKRRSDWREIRKWL